MPCPTALLLRIAAIESSIECRVDRLIVPVTAGSVWTLDQAMTLRRNDGRESCRCVRNELPVQVRCHSSLCPLLACIRTSKAII